MLEAIAIEPSHRNRAKPAGRTDVLWTVLVMLMLCFPRMLQLPKMCIAAILLATAFLDAGNTRFGRTLAFFSFGWFSSALLIVSVGLINGNPIEGITATMRVNILEVLVVVAIVATVSSDRIVALSLSVVCAANFYLGLFNVAFFVASLEGTDTALFTMLDTTSRMAFHEGYSHIVTTNLSMTIATFPLGLLSLNAREMKAPVSFGVISCFLAGAAMLLSGRRIIWFTLAASMAVFLFTGGKARGRQAVYLRTLLLPLVVVAVFFGVLLDVITLEGIIDRVKDAFSASSEDGVENARYAQAALLWNGFLSHPVFGLGAGATIDGFSRSADAPWSFEMSYNALLFQGGIVGVALYAAAIIALGKSTFKQIKQTRELGVAVFSAYVFSVISNATNPYFSSSFDFLIMLILPLLVVNANEVRAVSDDKANCSASAVAPKVHI